MYKESHMKIIKIIGFLVNMFVPTSFNYFAIRTSLPRRSFFGLMPRKLSSQTSTFGLNVTKEEDKYLLGQTVQSLSRSKPFHSCSFHQFTTITLFRLFATIGKFYCNFTLSFLLLLYFCSQFFFSLLEVCISFPLISC